MNSKELIKLAAATPILKRIARTPSAALDALSDVAEKMALHKGLGTPLVARLKKAVRKGRATLGTEVRWDDPKYLKALQQKLYPKRYIGTRVG